MSNIWFDRVSSVRNCCNCLTVGDLLYVEKNKCKKCGQYGHSKGTCQGKGYIGSITDAMQAEVYEQRNEEASATRKRKRAAGRVDTE